MSEPHEEEKQDEDLSPEEQRELEEFCKALENLGSKRNPSPRLFERMKQEIRKRFPESSQEEGGAVERLREERNRKDTQRGNSCGYMT
jgi:hypothetical protein